MVAAIVVFYSGQYNIIIYNLILFQVLDSDLYFIRSVISMCKYHNERPQHRLANARIPLGR